MAWIKTVPLAEADERLKTLLEAQLSFYPPEYSQPVHGVDVDPATGHELPGIVASHTLIPDALYHAFSTFGVLMSPQLPLTRRQHEMITTVVSVTNRCRY